LTSSCLMPAAFFQRRTCIFPGSSRFQVSLNDVRTVQSRGVMLVKTQVGWTAKSTTAAMQSLRCARRRHCGNSRKHKQEAWAVGSQNGAVPVENAAAAETPMISMEIKGVPYIRLDEARILACPAVSIISCPLLRFCARGEIGRGLHLC
jgi:hypothetical protein